MPAPAPRRKAIRIKGYDYSQPGAYFVTICVQRRECLLGSITGDAMVANAAGKVAEENWRALPEHYGNVELDAFGLMPKHLHGIIILKNDGAGLKPAPTGASTRLSSLSEVVRGFKTFSARRINELRGALGAVVWQRAFYEHVIRSERDLEAIRDYIAGNPAKWAEDSENPGKACAGRVGAGFKPARPLSGP